MLTKSSMRLLVGGSLLVVVAAVAAVASEDSRAFRIRDDCESTSFNAALNNPNACNPKFGGDTTFTKFINELTEDKKVDAHRDHGEVKDWRGGSRIPDPGLIPAQW
jgi:hypothetical protein